ncbi:NitT/TauT family transport system ATP-binding protein [Rubricella aquisinus]|uniref:NitT/TauT family transport system ATP-binding protein n=1 Tax=Rubricella aquisinus TaxID=2028108 RepID=A0A840WKJ2_9RHOB|nr:ABC transporter substrate-binding protein [Rubricella aquisinus]MBB5514182.1 NitT/TauT family transport system ATP-binding protein [Rubricella aquisinus]
MIGADVSLGFIPLTDAALPIIALEMGFAAEEGVALTLVRETSWSTIRDKIALGVYPAAHMLAPLAIAMSAGVGPMRAGLVAPMLLGTNGDTLTARPDFADRLVEHGARFGDAMATGRALVKCADPGGLRVGVPFPHSMHQELVRLLVERSGGDVSKVTFLTAPPKVLPEVLKAGEVDVFMVGEPWGSVAVERGAGEILLSGADIWTASPEKVLALQADWAMAHPDTMDALVRALYRASMWLTVSGNLGVAAEILALPHYLDASPMTIERALLGRLQLRHSGATVDAPDVIRLSGLGALYPWQSAAAFIAERAAPAWGISPIRAQAAALETFRPDLMHRALGPLHVSVPMAHARIEGRTELGVSVPGTSGPVRVGRSGFFDRSEFHPQT